MQYKIQASYDDLALGAQCLMNQADMAGNLNHQLCQMVEKLQAGGWQGQGAEAFFAEMLDCVLPGIKRLSIALHDASKTVQKISRIFQEAELEASRCFEVGLSGTAHRSSDTGNGGGTRAAYVPEEPPPLCAIGDTACQIESLRALFDAMGINFYPEQWSAEQIEFLYWAKMFSSDYTLGAPGNVAPLTDQSTGKFTLPCASLIASVFSQLGVFSERFPLWGVEVLMGVLRGDAYTDQLTLTHEFVESDLISFDPTNPDYTFGSTLTGEPVPSTILQAGYVAVQQWQSIQPGSVIVHYCGGDSCDYGRYPHVTMVAGWASQSPSGDPVLYPDYATAVKAGVTDPVPYVIDRGIGEAGDSWRGPRPFNENFNAEAQDDAQGDEPTGYTTTGYIIFSIQPEVPITADDPLQEWR